MVNGLVVFSSSAIVNVCNYFVQFTVSHVLPVVEYGLFASLTSLLTIAAVPASVFSTAAAKETAEIANSGQPELVSAIFKLFLRLALAFSTILIFAIVALSGNIGRFLHLSNVAPIGAVAFAILPWLLLPVARGVLQGERRFRWLSVSLSAEALSRVIIVGIIVVLFHSVPLAIYGIGVSGWLAFVLSLWPLRKQIDFRVRSRDLRLVRLLRATGAILVSALCLSALTFGDVIFAKHVLREFDAGLYGALSLCGRVVLFSTSFVSTLVLPEIARGKAPLRVLVRAGALTLVGSVIVIGLLSVRPDLAIRFVAGGKYIAAAPLVMPYALAMGALAVSTVIIACNIGAHRFVYLAGLALGTLVEFTWILNSHPTLAGLVDIVLYCNAGIVVGLALISVIDLRMHPAEISRMRLAETVPSNL